MINDFKNPHGKPTKQFNSIEFLLEQVVKGTYEYGEDKILHTTLPKSMIDHAKEMHKEEIKEALIDGAINARCIEYRILHYYAETFGGNNEQQ